MKTKKVKQILLALLTVCMVMCNVFAITAVATTISQDDMIAQSIGGPGDEGELQPMRAMACWATLSSGLNYYIGKNNWSYDANGQPYADGFTDIRQVVCMWSDGSLDVPSYDFRQMICDLHENNQNAEMLLRGEKGYLKKTIAQVMLKSKT